MDPRAAFKGASSVISARLVPLGRRKVLLYFLV